eukprot:UN03188
MISIHEDTLTTQCITNELLRHNLEINGNRETLLCRLRRLFIKKKTKRKNGMVSTVNTIQEEYFWTISAKAITITLAQDNEVESPNFIRCGKTWRIRLEKEGKELEIFLDSLEHYDSFSAEYTLVIKRKYR